ncbi:PREDICTED: protein SCO1 homolog, mitochondrial [Dinoponera quadriceps]|uniref:Protein SCO1 homolog, mitochondrial n=1 Tax=Dinoponera quadriceps TaxID=609295 RepID=A0A6P3WPA2_DINQU|nr:PREDICTED: protein SCO1 homolog, mitochondrial [Dinoponera quadriceps]
MSTLIWRSLVSLSRISNNAFTKFRHISTSKTLYQQSVLPKNPKKIKSPITWRSLTISGLVGTSLLLYMYYLRKEKDMVLARERKRQLGKAKIGGSFELIDTKEKTVKSDDFLGQWVLIYFGFTHCPDVCPDEIEKMTNVVDKLEKEHNFKIQPIFISVDPDRDTPVVVEKYLKEFSEKIIGLTGNTEQIAQACRAYRVYFSSGPKDQDDDYIVDHTIIIYLVDPEGLFVDYYGQTHDVDKIITSILMNKLKHDQLSGDSPSWLPALSIKGIL